MRGNGKRIIIILFQTKVFGILETESFPMPGSFIENMFMNWNTACGPRPIRI